MATGAFGAGGYERIVDVRAVASFYFAISLHVERSNQRRDREVWVGK